MELAPVSVGPLSIHIFSSRLRSINRLFTAGTMTGFDASGHIAEETKNARCIVTMDTLFLY